jgi:DNA-directed RNA polymerase subunit RPC12/RpoP
LSEHGKFSCSSCGRQFAWKAAQAGRRAKCTCGATIQIPATDPSKDQVEENLLDPMPVETIPVDAPVVPIYSTPVHAMRPVVVETSEDDAGDYDAIVLARDIYLPAILIFMALVLIIGWAGIKSDHFLLGALIMCASALIKTAIMVGLALLIGPAIGFQFGDIKTAVLKLAALVMFTDATVLWIESIVSEDAVSLRAVVVGFLFAIAMVVLLMFYLFGLTRQETRRVAYVFAIVSWAIGLGVNLLALMLLGAMGNTISATSPVAMVNAAATSNGDASTAGASDSATAAPASQPASAPVHLTPVTISPTIMDKKAEAMLHLFGMIFEVRIWNDQHVARFEPDLMNALSAAGVVKAYVGADSRFAEPDHLYVKLPEFAEKRDKIFAIYRDYCKSKNIPIDPEQDHEHNQEFLVITYPQANNGMGQ